MKYISLLERECAEVIAEHGENAYVAIAEKEGEMKIVDSARDDKPLDKKYSGRSDITVISIELYKEIMNIPV